MQGIGGVFISYDAGINPKRSTFNARAEGPEKSTLWSHPLQRHRCIVPISDHYEWKKPERTAFRFDLGKPEPFGLAGLWDAWKSPDGSWLQSFTIITTDPNTVAEQVHDRMPVILALKDYDEWLDRGEMERPPVHLLRPFASSGLKVYSAHPKEGNVRNQGLEMLNGE